MISARIARMFSGRLHYAWIVLGVMFLSTLCGMGVRSAPGVIIVPLQRTFGWSVGTISGAVSLNILLMGLLGPFIAALMERFGLRRVLLSCMVLLLAGTALSTIMHAPWQLYLTWGFMVGVGSSAGAIGMATAVVNRWFVASRGFAIGIMISANAAGQLIFLPLLAALSERYGWQAVSVAVSIAIAAVLPALCFLLPETPDRVGLLPYGATEPQNSRPRGGNPMMVALNGLVRGAKSLDFWLLVGSFGICGFSANGLVGTHMIAYCVDNGVAEVLAASMVASLGLFSLVGSAVSGWMTDRYNPRVLLFFIYSLRGLALLVIPFVPFDITNLTIFAAIYGFDWVATGPPTFALVNEVFGERDAPVIISWVFVGHQIGGALAAAGAGSVRGYSGSYLVAFVASGAACMLAALLVLRVTRRRPALVPA